MINKTFYPTPHNLISDMWAKVQNKSGTILEPSAGKGDILDYVDKAYYGYNSRKPKLHAIELDPTLSTLLTGKGYKVIADDFLEFRTYTRYDVIMMNPPFDNGEKHLLKAIELMKNGGEIVCLLNAETIKNPFSNERKRLVETLNKLEANITYKEKAFAQAERKTNVDIALIYINIEKSPLESDLFKGIQFDINERHETIESTNEVAKYEADEIIRLVKDYETEIELFSLAYNANRAYNAFAKLRKEECNHSETEVCMRYDSSHRATYEAFLLDIRQKYWRLALKTKAMDKYLTYKVTKKVDELLEKQAEIEFNELNIMRIKQVLLAFFIQNLEESALMVFDDAVKYAQNEYNGNVHYYSGWKTNKACRLNKKIIRPNYDRHRDFAYEFEKVLNYFDAFKPYEQIKIGYSDSVGVYKGKYFDVQIYIKGTAHITFKRLDLLDQLNAFVGHKRNWLPDEYASKTEKTKYNKEVYQHFTPDVELSTDINISGVRLLS